MPDKTSGGQTLIILSLFHQKKKVNEIWHFRSVWHQTMMSKYSLDYSIFVGKSKVGIRCTLTLSYMGIAGD